MKKIPLGGKNGTAKGNYAIVDDADYDFLMRWKWYAQFKVGGIYVIRNATKAERQNGKKGTLLMHREIVGAKNGFHVDHKNGNPLDNRRSNLRECTPSQNQMNRKNMKENGGIPKGVSWHGSSRKWSARIRKDGRIINLGFFPSIEKAAQAYRKAAKKLFGEYARF